MSEREGRLDQQASIMHHDESVAAKLKRLVSSQSYAYMRTVMIEMLHLEENQALQIVDVGCGEGAFCRDVSARVGRGSQIIGLDVSENVLDIARAQGNGDQTRGEIAYMVGDMMHLPFSDASCDVVICAGTLKYLETEERERAALEEMMRVLRPGGTLLVLDNDDYSITYAGVEDEELERKVVGAYASLQGDAQCGLRLPALCADLGLEGVEYREVLLEETNDFSLETAGRAMADNMHDVLVQRAQSHTQDSMVTEDEVERFYGQVQDAVHNGAYQWRYSKYALVGKKKG